MFYFPDRVYLMATSGALAPTKFAAIVSNQAKKNKYALEIFKAGGTITCHAFCSIVKHSVLIIHWAPKRQQWAHDDAAPSSLLSSILFEKSCLSCGSKLQIVM